MKILTVVIALTTFFASQVRDVTSQGPNFQDNFAIDY
jgi:hypothetical protein